MQITVKNNQSIFDIALLKTGSIEEAINMSILFGISITDIIEAGTVLDFTPIITSKKILNYFENNKLTPATALAIEAISSRIFDTTFDFTFE